MRTSRFAPQHTPMANIQVQKPMLHDDAYAQFNFIPAQHASRNIQEGRPSRSVQEQHYEGNVKSSGHEPPQSVLTTSVRSSNLSGNLADTAGLLDLTTQGPRGAAATTSTAGKQTFLTPAPHSHVIPHEPHGPCPQQETPVSEMDKLMTSNVEILSSPSESDIEDKSPCQSGDVVIVINSNHCRRASTDQDQYYTPGPRTPQPPVQNLVSPEADRMHLTTTRRSRPSCVSSSAMHSSRISKTPKKPRARSTHVERRPTPATAEPQQPSEEDLLYILMSRNRQTRSALERLQCLEEENVTLRHGKAASDAELQQSLNYQQQVESERDMLCKSLEAFKEKYYKLKKWALEANQDCEGLANDASVLKQSLTEVSRDRDNLFKQLKDIKTVSQCGSEKMDSLRSKIRDARAAIQDQSATISHLSGQFLQQEERLIDEKHRCRRLETHLLHVEQERNKQILSNTGKADMLDATMLGLSGKLQTLMNDREARISENVNAFNAFMEMCQMVHEKDLATNADIKEVTQSVDTLKLLMQGHLDSVTETFEVSMADLIDELQQQRPVGAEEIQSQEDSSAVKRFLEDRVTQLKQLINIPHTGENETNDGQGKPLFATNAIREVLEVHKNIYRQQISSLQNEMNNLSTKFEAAQSENSQLSTMHRVAEDRIVELETERQAALSKADSLSAKYEEVSAQKGDLLGQLVVAHVTIDEISTDRENIRTENTNIKKERNVAQTHFGKLSNINEEAQSRISELEANYKAAQRRIDELTKSHQSAQNTVDDLIAAYKAVRFEQEELTVKHDAAQDTIEKLSRKYTNAQSGWTRTAEKCETAEAQLDEVSRNLEAAERKLRTCKHQLKERREELEGLDKDLDNARINEDSLTAALDQAKDEIGHLTCAKRQHEIEIHDLQNDLDDEIHQRQGLEEKLDRHKDRLAESEHKLIDAQAVSHAAALDKEDLQLHILSLEGSVALGRETIRKLAETNKALETMPAELNALRQKQIDFEKLQQTTVSQQNELLQKSLEIQSTRQTISEMQETTANLENNARNNEHLAKENLVLGEKIAQLQGQILDQAGQLENAVQYLRNEKEALSTAHAATRKKAAESDALQLKNEELTESIRSMRADLQQARHECGRLPLLNQAITDLGNSIATVQEQLKTAMMEAEENAREKDVELRRKIEQITLLEVEKASLQQELLVCEGELANAKLDKEAQARPQRRVADRSGKRVPVAKEPTYSGSTDNVEGVEFVRDDVDSDVERPTPRSTGNFAVVPETQFDQRAGAHTEENDSLADEALLNDGSTSELSSVPEDLVQEDNQPKEMLPKHQGKGSQKHNNQMQLKHHAMDRAPSSSYSSQGEQMLLDQLSQNDSGLVPSLSTLPSTIPSRQDSDNEDVVGESNRTNVMPWNRADLNNARSRMRLRSESHFRGRQSTPFPEQAANPLLNQDITPAPARERYQPNSAAKRTLDHDDISRESQDTSKRLKRNHTNLEVKGRRDPSAKSPTDGQISPRVTSGFRKGGSMDGTNASATGKSHRATKPARKSSRQGKYAARFAVEI
ncbi:hypothetical protein LTR13_006393 [Exophiala sideris]|nr:hypothetical protein LTR13_006393 [Exophiala sideris]